MGAGVGYSAQIEVGHETGSRAGHGLGIDIGLGINESTWAWTDMG